MLSTGDKCWLCRFCGWTKPTSDGIEEKFCRMCAQAVERVDTARVLDGRYLLERPLASGNMAVLWAATQLSARRQVAVKLLPESALKDERVVERFELEAHVLAQLDSPHVVKVLDYVGPKRGVPYLVMELLPGENLEQRLLRGPLSAVEAMGLWMEFVEGVALAHKRGVIHRDLKPANLFVTRRQSALDEHEVGVVVDFGLAKVEGLPLTQQTQTGALLGTLVYMSPEQLIGASATAASDVYALALTLVEMLTGLLPWGLIRDPALQRRAREETADAFSFAYRRGKAEPPHRLQQLRPERRWPAALETLVERALAFPPQERQKDAGALLLEMKKVLKASPASTWEEAPASPPPPARATPVVQGAGRAHPALPSKPTWTVGAPIRPESRLGAVVAEEYQIRSILGQGELGVTYKAFHTRLRSYFHVLMLRRENPPTHEMLNAAKQALGQALRFSRLGVIPIRMLYDDEGVPGFATESLEGESLRQRLALGPLSLASALALVLQVAKTLEATHAEGLIHGDLRPETLFLVRPGARNPLTAGRVTLLKYALRHLRAHPTDFDDELPLRKLRYRPPEQIAGLVRDADAAGDSFQLGAILYECLTGEPAFAGDNVESVLDNLSRPPPALQVNTASGLTASFIDPLNRIIRSCCSPAPQERRNMGETHSALGGLVSGMGILLPPTIWEDPPAPTKAPLLESAPVKPGTEIRSQAAAAPGEAQRQREEARRLEEEAQRKTEEARRKQKEDEERRKAEEKRRVAQEARRKREEKEEEEADTLFLEGEEAVQPLLTASATSTGGRTSARYLSRRERREQQKAKRTSIEQPTIAAEPVVTKASPEQPTPMMPGSAEAPLAETLVAASPGEGIAAARGPATTPQIPVPRGEARPATAPPVHSASALRDPASGESRPTAAPPSAGARWYVIINGEQIGPLSAEDVRARFAGGQLDSESFLWREGYGDWIKLNQSDDFRDLREVVKYIDVGQLSAELPGWQWDLLPPAGRSCPSCGKLYYHSGISFCARDGTRLSDDRWIGKVIEGRVRLTRLLGAGRSGVVYEADHLRTQKRMAVHIYDQLTRQDQRQRGLKQLAISAQVSHPNIAVLDDYGALPEGPLFAVIEFLPGETLRSHLTHAGKLSVAAALSFWCPMVDAICSAHSAGCVHNNLRPENVFIQDQVKVTDFAIGGREMDPNYDPSDNVMVSAFQGWPEYASIHFDANHPGGNLFSLGLLLVEMLTGPLPLPSYPTRMALERWLPERLGGFSVELRTLLSRLLSDDLWQQPASVDLPKLARKLR